MRHISYMVSALFIVTIFLSCSINTLGLTGEIDTLYYSVENHAVESFLKSPEYDNSDYSYTYIENFYESEVRNDQPKTCELRWNPIQGSNQRLILERVEDNTIVEAFIEKGKTTKEIANLTPGFRYNARIDNYVEGNWQNVGQWVIIPRGYKRMIKTDSCWNMRDLGGWKTQNGRRVKYELLYRGAELTGEHGICLSQSDKAYLSSIIDVELDLRGISELDFDDTDPTNNIVSSALGNETEYVNINVTAYSKGLELKAAQYRNCFKIVLASISEGKSVFFHCWAGADRTGTLSFLLLGALGVSESDLCKEYELTSYSPLIKNKSGFRTRNSTYFPFVKFVNTIKTYGKVGDSINTCVNNYLLSIGISVDEIEELKSIMLE